MAVCALIGASPASAAPLFTPVSGSPFATGGTDPLSVAFNPSGQLLVTGNGSYGVSVFSVAASGALTQVSGSPFDTGGDPPGSVAFSPSGRFVAGAGTGDASPSVLMLSVASSGALTPVSGSPFATGGDVPWHVAFSPNGQLLATANTNANTVSVFSVAASGALTQVSGSPFPAGFTSPSSVAFSPNGRLLATADAYVDGRVSVFSVAASGALTPVTGSPFATGSEEPVSVAFSPSGRFLATANSSGDASVSVFSVAASGALTPVSGSPFATGTPLTPPWSVAFSPCGGLLATGTGIGTLATGNTASVFSIGASGALTPVSGSPFIVGGYAPFSVAFSPNGQLLATANRGPSSVSVLRYGPGSPVCVPSVPTGLTATPGNGSVTLTWQPNPTSDKVTHYNVYRTDQSFRGPWATPTGTTFTNASNVVNGARYCYEISATNGNGEGPTTASVCATPKAPPPPAPSITGHPASRSTQTTASFAFTDSQAGVRFSCQLDSGAFTTCASPVRYTGLRIGQHSFHVRAIDAFGQTSGVASYTWTVAARYVMTVATAGQWALAAVITRLYGNRRATTLTAFHVSGCVTLSGGRLRCQVSWRKPPYSYSGTITLGNLNPTTGTFKSSLNVLRQNTRTGAKKRITLRY